MPLSEHEQQVLEELERTLLADDPDLVNTMRSGARAPVGTYVLGAIGLLVGLGVLILGVVLEQPIIGVAGFAVMFAAVAYAMTRAARIKAAGEQSYDLGSATVNANTAPKVRAGQNRDNFMARVEERWDRRIEGR